MLSRFYSFFSSLLLSFFGNPVPGCQASPTSLLLPSTEAIAIAILSPESCQSVFSTSPDFAFPPTPSSSPPLLSQPCVRPASVSIGSPTPPDSVGSKAQSQLTHPLARRKIFRLPWHLIREIFGPPLCITRSQFHHLRHSIYGRHQLQVTSL